MKRSAREMRQRLTKTLIIALCWVSTWKVVAPLLGVQVLSLGELLNAVSAFLSIIPTQPPIAAFSPFLPLHEMLFGVFAWMLALGMAGFAGATVVSALVYWLLWWRRTTTAVLPGGG